MTATENGQKDDKNIELEQIYTKSRHPCSTSRDIYRYQPSRKRQTMTALLNMITKILILDVESETVGTQTGETAARTPRPHHKGTTNPGGRQKPPLTAHGAERRSLL